MISSVLKYLKCTTVSLTVMYFSYNMAARLTVELEICVLHAKRCKAHALLFCFPSLNTECCPSASPTCSFLSVVHLCFVMGREKKKREWFDRCIW